MKTKLNVIGLVFIVLFMLFAKINVYARSLDDLQTQATQTQTIANETETESIDDITGINKFIMEIRTFFSDLAYTISSSISNFVQVLGHNLQMFFSGHRGITTH